LADKPEMRDDAVRLLYRQAPNRHLSESRTLSLKRIVETAIHDDPDDWTIVLDEGDNGLSPVEATNDDSIAVPAHARRQTVSRIKAVSLTQKRSPDPAKVRTSVQALPHVVDSHDTLVPGVVLSNRFVLEELLGRGGIGIVYRARDLLRDPDTDGSDRLALKVLREEYRSSEQWKSTLQHEALRAQRLSHPNIVRVHDFHQDGETCFLTMELLEGELLRAAFSRQALIPVARDRAMQIIPGLCRGLEYAHGTGLVHGDFKPGNVFLTKGDEPKILDFGVVDAMPDVQAGDLVASSSNSGPRVITPAYASCNRLEGGTPAFSDDVYSLSCVIYELLAGRHPYDRKSSLVARELHLQPERIQGLTDLQWRTLANGLRPSRRERTTEVHDLQIAFSDVPATPPAPAPQSIVAPAMSTTDKQESHSGVMVPAVTGGLIGASLVAVMALLGINPLPSNYVDLVRESAPMRLLQDTLDRGADVSPAAADVGLMQATLDKEDNADTVIADRFITDSAAPPVQDSTQPAADDSGLVVPESTATDAVAESPDATTTELAVNPYPSVETATPLGLGESGSELAIAGPTRFNFGSATYSIAEHGTALAVQINRQGNFSKPASVEWTTIADTAEPQVDYAGTSRSMVKFAAGETTQTIFIPIVSDATPEGDEVFRITLHDPTGQPTLGEPSSATVVIVDDDY
jgi:serine/threonine protein kinase